MMIDWLFSNFLKLLATSEDFLKGKNSKKAQSTILKILNQPF